jgi:hypothetical protein
VRGQLRRGGLIKLWETGGQAMLLKVGDGGGRRRRVVELGGGSSHGRGVKLQKSE